jgi:hypothetical protein
MQSQPIAAAEVKAVRSVVSTQRNSAFFRSRQQRNILSPPHQFDNGVFWKQMIVCMCTSVQPSGLKSRVSRLAREKPFPLSLDICESDHDLRNYASAILHRYGSRFGPKISKQIAQNLAWLQEGGWQIAHRQFRAVIDLPVESSPGMRIAAERMASRTLMGRTGGLAGFGPKQSRYLWQCLGVTQYEIPLDGRICNWIDALPTSFRINPSRLYSNVTYYEEVMSHIQAVCEEAGVLPCEFDAAVFAGADNEEWPEDDVVF